MTGPRGIESGAPRRWVVVALIALGVGLTAAPAIFQMFDRAPMGATMIRDFKPFMTEERMASFQADIAEIRDGVAEAQSKAPALLGATGGAAGLSTAYPEFAAFTREWPPIDRDMSEMLTTIKAQIPNYEAVAALPPFGLFPWFFVIPGLLLAALAAVALLRPAWWRALRIGLVVLGVGLIAAPFAFQMFDRAPRGAKMISAFKDIETRQKVEAIQGYFGQIAAGQGSLRLEIVPALAARGVDGARLERDLPAVATLDRQWVPILQNLTPMIGAMSDNVVNYDAVRALPPFTLFPWFFVLPGLIVICLALFAGRGATSARSDGGPGGGDRGSTGTSEAQDKPKREDGQDQ